MKDWTIRRRILVSFGIILMLMIVMSAIAYVRLTQIGEDTDALRANSLPGLIYGTQLRTDGVENYSLVKAHILQRDPAGMRKIEEALKANQSRAEGVIAQFLGMTLTGHDLARLNVFREMRNDYLRIQKEIVKASSEEATKALAITRQEAELEPAFEKRQAAIQAVVENDKDESMASTSDIVAAVRAARTVILAACVVALLLAALCGYLLFQAVTQPMSQLVAIIEVMRTGDFSQRLNLQRGDEFGILAAGFNRMTDEITTLVGQVQQTGIQVNTSVLEIVATARQQQATASEIAAATTEIGATSKEISATSRELMKTMDEVSTVAEQSAILAGNGQGGLIQMEETMRHVMEAAGSINAKLAVLSEKAGNIGQVVTTITKVADQTNMLSLNAAIEAEKAGEYGRGFAVVATEIRRLADQTAVATYDIEQMVREIQSAVSAGVMGMDKFSEEVRRGMQEVQQVGGQLSQIIHQVQALAPRFETVNEGMQAQTTGAAEITQALGQLSEAAQQTVESLQQSSAAIDDLNSVSNHLTSAVSSFKLRQKAP
ncbi:MAG: methyl-accepting chemotaxis protein [Verrucomicrobiota bacterium]